MFPLKVPFKVNAKFQGQMPGEVRSSQSEPELRILWFLAHHAICIAFVVKSNS